MQVQQLQCVDAAAQAAWSDYLLRIGEGRDETFPSADYGMANGTRLVCQRFSRHAIEADIISGSHAGGIVLIPHIMMQLSDAELPFDLKRWQVL